MNSVHAQHDFSIEDHIAWWNSNVRNTRATMIVLGIALLVVGVFCAFAPFSMYEIVQIFAAAALIVHGVTQIVAYFKMPSIMRSPTLPIAGVLNAILGVLIFTLPPYLMVEFCVYMLGFVFIVTGVERIMFASKTRHIEQSHSALMTVTGVVNIVMGVLFFLAPLFTSIALSYVVAAYLIIGGAMLIVEAFSMHTIKVK